MPSFISPQPLLTLLSQLDPGNRRCVIAAVSGGSDSLALLMLAKARLRHGQTRLIAVTIDHGLRSTSADEAGDVATLCAARGIEHRILRWSGPKPESGLAAAAREARYRLLAQAAGEAGADLILTGHTLDDQAETIAMRLSRGEGKGLAGMAPATLHDGKIWIIRPLLGCRRAELRDYLRSINVDWIDDPSNQDMTYERARIRAQGVEIDEDRIAQAARERIALSENVAAVVKKYARPVSAGLVRLAPEFAEDESPACIEALRLLLAIMGGTEHPVDARRAATLFERLKGEPLRTTLSRSIVDVRRSGIFLYREARGLPAPMPLYNGMVWDGRFLLPGEGGMVEPIGLPRAHAMVSETGDAPQSLMRLALSTWPAMQNEAEKPVTARQPDLACQDRPIRATPLLAPWRHFLPSFDLAAAASLACLIGAPPIAPLPFIGIASNSPEISS